MMPQSQGMGATIHPPYRMQQVALVLVLSVPYHLLRLVVFRKGIVGRGLAALHAAHLQPSDLSH